MVDELSSVEREIMLHIADVNKSKVCELGGIRIIEDSNVPNDEIWIERDGKMLGKIRNFDVES